MIRLQYIEETASTNTLVAQMAAKLEDGTMLIARRQTAGRGQRGNSWESEPGKNLTFSLFLKPINFPARDQFYISEAFSLAIVDALADFGVSAKVKWPNDIYVGDRKICGILIEHAVMGMNLMHTIAGAGINVNQSEFHSDAPNPISIIQLTGAETSLEDFALNLAGKIDRRLRRLWEEPDRSALHREYLSALWRRDGELHPFRDVSEGETYMARIKDVESMGHLILEAEDGTGRRYAFKEVEFLL